MTYLKHYWIPIMILMACGKQTEVEYYENGEIRYEVALNAKGERDGIYNEYFSDGSLKATWNYKNGIEDGDYKEFSKAGKLSISGTMKQGDFIQSEGYDSLGNIFEKRLYKDGMIYYVEKFDKGGNKKEQIALPILPSRQDTVLIGENHCLTVQTGIQFSGEVTLTIGHLYENKMQHIDTIKFTDQSYQYCIQSKFLGQNEIRGFFDHKKSDQDTATIDKMSFKHVFYVTSKQPQVQAD